PGVLPFSKALEQTEAEQQAAIGLGGEPAAHQAERLEDRQHDAEGAEDCQDVAPSVGQEAIHCFIHRIAPPDSRGTPMRWSLPSTRRGTSDQVIKEFGSPASVTSLAPSCRRRSEPATHYCATTPSVSGLCGSVPF